MLNINRRISFY